MKKHNRRIWGLVFAFVMMLANVMFVPMDFKTTEVNAAESGIEAMSSVEDIQEGLTLHCWNWSYKNIEANMATIAAQGYTAIQTSPIQQAKEGTKGYSMNGWWVYYQPMGFHIDNTGNSALGTKAEFTSMCKTAHEYGIKVIVDVVANHLGNRTGNNLATTIVSDIKNDAACWHDYSKNTSNYYDRYDVTQHCMGGLPDLNTGNTKIQNYVIGFLKECIDAGADGFRFDAAKHIETPSDNASYKSNFWPNVINTATTYAKSKGKDLYCYGEILDDLGGGLSIGAYTQYMSVTDNRWGNDLRNCVSNGNAGGYYSTFRQNTVASNLVLWAESHDTFANADGGSTGVSVQNINKTWALVAARTDAMGLYFARPSSTNLDTPKLGDAAKTGWSYPEVKAVNLFHNAFVGHNEYLANQNGIAYCERGTSGVVLVNCNGTSATVNVKANQMAAGTYKDQITGNTFTVEGGRIKGNIGSTGIAVVYNAGSTGTPTPTPTPTSTNVVYLDLPSGWGSNVYCYVYENENINNAAWPGVAMTKMPNGLYKYEVPNEINNPKVLFTDGTNQYPGANEPGLELSGTMIYQNGNWKTYTVPKGTVVVKYVDASGKSISDSVTLEGEVGTSYSTSAKTISGYTFSKVSGSANGKYTSGQITIQYIYTKNVSGTDDSGENETDDNNTGDNNSGNNGGNNNSGNNNTGNNSGNNTGANNNDNSTGSDNPDGNTGNNTSGDNTNNGSDEENDENNDENNTSASDENDNGNGGNVNYDEDATTSDNKENNENNDNTVNGDADTPSSDGGNNDSSTTAADATQNNTGDNEQKSDKKGFPWPAVIIPVAVIGAGVGAYIWYKKKNTVTDTTEDRNNM